MRRRFFIIGAAKSGTTTLFRCLARHSDICACTIKEPAFYCSIRTPSQRAEYEALFPHSAQHQWSCEATTDYTKSPSHAGVAQRIAADVPDARLIYLVRDPIRRAFSHYVHNLVHNAHHAATALRFREAIRVHTHYTDVSKYAMQLQPYRDVFAKDQVLVLQFERLAGDPESVINTVLSFLGLPTPPLIGEGFHRNRSANRRIMRKPWAKFLNAYPRLNPLLGVLPKALLTRAAPHYDDELDEAVEDSLVAALRDDVRSLIDAWDIDLALWNTKFSRSQ